MKEFNVNRKIELIFVLVLVSAILLSYAAARFPVLPLDLKAYEELKEKANPLFDSLMTWVSAIGELAIATTLTAIAMLIFAVRREWLESIFVLATTSSVLLALMLKELIHRTRPFPLSQDVAGSIWSAGQYSYPSGHVLFFVVFFGFFAYLSWIHFAGRARAVIIAICGALIMLIGPSRVFLDAHWASDVLGGYIIGAIWLFLLILTYQWAKHLNLS